MKTSFCIVMMAAAVAGCSRTSPDADNPPAPAASSPAAQAAQAPAAPATAQAPVLSAQGYGRVRFGATLESVEKLLGEKALQLGENDPACSSVRFKAQPGARFMVENGVITRADADNETPNESGIVVGDTLAQAQKKVPGLLLSPHKYVPEGHYLTVRGAQPNSAIVMEEDGKAVTKIRAGLEPAVNYVEVCL